MARQPEGIELGLAIYDLNGDTPILVRRISADPGADSVTNGAEQGSLFIRENGTMFQKKLSGSGADKFVRMANIDDITAISWRSETVRVATGDAAPSTGSAIDLTSNPFGDDNAPLLDAGDFTVGEYVLFGVGGTPKLMEVTSISAPNITVTDAPEPLVTNDMMIIRNYLPDAPDDQEKQSIALYNGADVIKLSDFNWSIATGITLSGSYSASSGNVSPSDTVEVAIQKLDGVNDAQDSVLGTAQGATNLGTFTGDIISDNTSTKVALQEVETELVDTRDNADDLITLSGVAENAVNQGLMDQGDILPDNATENALFKSADAELTRQRGKVSATGVTTIQAVDSVLVDNVSAFNYEVTIENASSPANKVHFRIFAGHNGHASGDATSVDDTVGKILKFGSNFDYAVSVDLNGVGASQVMRLNVSSGEASGVNVYAKRTEVLF